MYLIRLRCIQATIPMYARPPNAARRPRHRPLSAPHAVTASAPFRARPTYLWTSLDPSHTPEAQLETARKSRAVWMPFCTDGRPCSLPSPTHRQSRPPPLPPHGSFPCTVARRAFEWPGSLASPDSSRRQAVTATAEAIFILAASSVGRELSD